MRILYLPNSHCQQRQLEKPNFLAYPVLLAMEAEWYRKQGHEVLWHYYSGWEEDLMYKTNGMLQRWNIIQQLEGLPFLSLPHPDRVFTDAKNPKYQRNGNFKYLPATYIQSASGCWWGKCEFCVEKGKPYEVRPVEDVISEIRECFDMGFMEVFDDSATFPTGEWLEKFCSCFLLHAHWYGGKKRRISCNMRMVDVDYKRMKYVGFRMLLFGLESANQKTLDKINKGRKVEDVKYIIKAAKAGLEPHIAVMFFPGESDKDSLTTLRLVWWLLKKGYAKTAQASVYNPTHIIQDSPETRKARTYVRRIYDTWRSPSFWLTKLLDIHDKDDLKYLWRQIKAGLNV